MKSAKIYKFESSTRKNISFGSRFVLCEGKILPGASNTFEANEDNQLLLSSYELDLNEAYAIFFNAPWGSDLFNRYTSLPISDITDFDGNDLEKIVCGCLNFANYISATLQAYCAEIHVLCTTMTYDFCVLVPKSLPTDMIEFICLKIETMYLLWQKHEDTEAIQKNIDKINTVRYSNVSFSENRHKDIYSAYITKLLHRSMHDTDMKNEDILLASLVLKKCQEETFYRWVYDSGDVCFEAAPFYKEYERQFNIYSDSVKEYIDQTQEFSKHSTWVRAILNLTQELSRALLNECYKQAQNDYNSDWYNKPYEMLKMNFYGLYPIIICNQKDNGISSEYPMHYSEEFCHGFLYIPLDMICNLKRFIPAYTHELFHYIPPLSRKDRNDVIIELVVHSLLVYLRDEIYKNFGSEGSQLCQKIYSCYVNNLKNYFKSSLERLAPSGHTELNTLNLEVLLPVRTYLDSPQSFFETIKNTELTFDEVEDRCNKVLEKTKKIFSDENFKSNCVFLWEYEAESYTTTFNSVLRELRSDFAMCTLLGIDLSDYLKLMAEEPEWAAQNVESTADSVIIRLGLMTRILYNDNQDGLSIFPNSAERDDAWESKCYSVIRELKKSSDNAVTIEHLDNMESYIREYKKIALDQEDIYAQDGLSLLEKTVSPLIKDWKHKEVTQYARTRFAQWLREIYHSNKQLTNPEWLLAVRVFFRNFHSNIEAIEKNKT